MNKFYIFFILLIVHFQLFAQDRFVKKAIESQQSGDYAESLDLINRYIEKEPLQPYGYLLKSKWLSDRLNPWGDPDSAYNVLMKAEAVFHLNYLKESKENKKDLFNEYVVFHEAVFEAYQDTLAKMTYEKLLVLNSIEKFDAYFQKYTKFSYAISAKIKADHLRYLNVVKEDKLEEYQKFIRLYPEAADVPQATYRIHELAYDRAIVKGTTEAFRIYITQYPTSHLVETAWREIYRIEYAQVINSNDEVKLEAYLSSYPKSAYSTAVTNKLYEVAYQNVLKENTSQAYATYVQKYPKSPHNEECFELQMKTKWYELNQQSDLSMQDLVQYLLDFPNSPYKDSVEMQQANLEFENISESNDADDFIRFMNQFPNSSKFTLAKQTAISLLSNNATSLINQDQLDAAREVLDKILALDINHALSYYLYAHILKEQGSLSEAISRLSIAIQLQPKNAEYYAQRGLYNIDNDELASAYSDLTKSVSLDPYLPKANFGLGIIKDKRNDYSSAINYYKKSLSGGYDVSDRIDYLESYIQQMRAQRAERSTKVETVNSKSSSKSSSKKNLLLPKETIERLNKRKN